jgi:hypothetical protein
MTDADSRGPNEPDPRGLNEPDPRGLRSPQGVSKPSKPSRPRRRRSTTEALLSIVLILEAALLFFATLTIFGLKALEPLPAFLGGGIFFLLLVVTSRLVRYRWGVWLGWVLQAALIATGFIIPIMFIVGLGFAALWVYCFVRARDVDRQRSAIEAHLAAEDSTTASPDPTPGQSPREGTTP